MAFDRCLIKDYLLTYLLMMRAELACSHAKSQQPDPAINI